MLLGGGLLKLATLLPFWSFVETHPPCPFWTFQKLSMVGGSDLRRGGDLHGSWKFVLTLAFRFGVLHILCIVVGITGGDRSTLLVLASDILRVICDCQGYLGFIIFMAMNLCSSSLCVTRVSEVFRSQILTSAYPLQSSKLLGFQKLYGRRY